jgi:hypothetical protein
MRVFCWQLIIKRHNSTARIICRTTPNSDEWWWWWLLHLNSKTDHCVLIIHQDQLNMTQVMDNKISTRPLRALLQHYVMGKHDAIIK